VPAISANGRSNGFIGILCSPLLYDFVNRAYRETALRLRNGQPTCRRPVSLPVDVNSEACVALLVCNLAAPLTLTLCSQREAVFGARMRVVQGELQNEMNLIHVVARKMRDYSHWLGCIRTDSRDFR
jgi:hypothetical protein